MTRAPVAATAALPATVTLPVGTATLHVHAYDASGKDLGKVT
jgi:hypothetical protein